ncbi:TPA: hypothetical protein N6791_004945 [Escherichia coli]|nr:hypothetical protein [Escherichia coli]HCO0513843.1 hypothetical protein [Escherichia coli]HCO0518601.1 hypothetical protein [Escherichia coli]
MSKGQKKAAPQAFFHRLLRSSYSNHYRRMLPKILDAQPKWHDIVIKEHQGEKRINRINEEICVMQALRNRLRSKEIWVVGADRYRNPDDDLPQDFDANRENYYRDLGKTTDATAFVSQLRHEMNAALAVLNRDMPRNRKVKILSQGKNRISITPFEPREEPVNLAGLKREIAGRWPMTSLLDVLKEADL